jgi:regulator of RNase E activity RraA
MRTLFVCLFVFAAITASAQTDTGDPAIEELRAGRGYIETPIFSLEEDQKLLAQFGGLRVADVSDGMDAVGLPNTGLMDPAIHPLWKDTETYRHRFVGIAVTARYVPTNRPSAAKKPVEDFDAWVGEWYWKVSPEPFDVLLREGSALVLDDANSVDVGSIGSYNILAWKRRGMVGLVTNATARDTDEIETQRVPLYFRGVGRGIRPGRNEIESVNRPVVCGGVLVIPGDVVVADGDGVIVVPRAVAEEVAAYARKILDSDKAGRRELYRELGLAEDPSIE